MVGEPGATGFFEVSGGIGGAGGADGMHEAAGSPNPALRETAGGIGAGRAAVLRDGDGAGRVRDGGAGEKPGGAPDKDRRESGASGDLGRFERLDAGLDT